MLISALSIAGDLPDARVTPGAVDQNITQSNIHSTICKPYYAKSVRPAKYFTNSLKWKQLHQYGYGDLNPTHYEEDHLIALSIGGNPTDERNLWPEPRSGEWGAEKKDVLEFVLYRMVCTDEIALVQAQRAMASDWIDAYKKYVPSHPNFRWHGERD